MPTESRPRALETASVVPLPANGSRTTHGANSTVWQSHDCFQPTVSTATPATLFAHELPVPASPVRLT